MASIMASSGPSKGSADANVTQQLPTRSVAVASNDPYMIELLRQQHENLSKMAALIQMNGPSPPLQPPMHYPGSAMPYTGAALVSSDPRFTQSSAPMYSMEAKHPLVIRNRQPPPSYAQGSGPIPRSGSVSSSRSSPREPKPRVAVPTHGAPHLNRSFRGMCEDGTIVSDLDFSQGSFSELSTTSWSASNNTAMDHYQEMVKATRRSSNAKGKVRANSQAPTGEQMARQEGANMDPSDYNALLAGPRKNSSSLNESKLAEYENMLADKTMSPRKTAKPKNHLLTVSQKLKAVSTIITSTALMPEGERTSEGTGTTGYTVNTDEISQSSSQQTNSSSTKKGREKSFKMDPVCFSSVSLDEFKECSTATNDPYRAQLIQQQLCKPEVQKLKFDRPPKAEPDEWTKMLTTKEFRYEPSQQSHSNRFRSFDERLMSGENEGRIL